MVLQTDKKFNDVLISTYTMNEPLPPEDRLTIFIPNDAALAQAPAFSSQVEEIIENFVASTLSGDHTTDSIFENIATSTNGSSVLLSLVASPIIFTSRASAGGDALFVRTPEMRTSARVVVPNIETCVGYVHIINKLFNTSVDYDSIPEDIYQPPALANRSATPTFSTTQQPAATVVPTTTAPSSTASDSNESAIADDRGLFPEPDIGMMPAPLVTIVPDSSMVGDMPSEGDEGSGANLPVVIGVSASVAICVMALACIFLFCIRDRYLFSLGEKDASKDGRLLRGPQDLPSLPSVNRSPGHSIIAPSSNSHGGFYLHPNRNTNTSQSDIACPSQPFRQTPSGRIVPMDLPPGRTALPNPVVVPEVSSGQRPVNCDGASGGQVSSIPLRKHRENNRSRSLAGAGGDRGSGEPGAVGGLKGWGSWGKTETTASEYSEPHSKGPGSAMSGTLLQNHPKRSGQAQFSTPAPPWAPSSQDRNQNIPLNSGAHQVPRGGIPPLSVTGVSRNYPKLSSLRSSAWGSAAAMIAKMSPGRNSSKAGNSSWYTAPDSERTQQGGVSRLSGVEVDTLLEVAGGGPRSIEESPSAHETPTTLQMHSKTLQNEGTSRDRSAVSPHDCSGGEGGKKFSFQLRGSSQGLPCLNEGVQLSGKNGANSIHATSQSNSGSGRGKASSVHIAAPPVVTTPYQFMVADQYSVQHVESLSKGIPCPEMPDAKSEQAENCSTYTLSQRGTTNSTRFSASAVSNYVTPFPSGLLPKDETSATVTGTDSLEVLGSNPATLFAKNILNTTTRELKHCTPTVANATLQLATHEEHALHEQSNLKMTSGDLDFDFQQSGAHHSDNIGHLANTNAITSGLFAESGPKCSTSRPLNSPGALHASVYQENSSQPETACSTTICGSSKGIRYVPTATGPSSVAMSNYHSVSSHGDDNSSASTEAEEFEVAPSHLSDVGSMSLPQVIQEGSEFLGNGVPETSCTSAGAFYTPHDIATSEDQRSASRESEQACSDLFDAKVFKEEQGSLTAAAMRRNISAAQEPAAQQPQELTQQVSVGKRMGGKLGDVARRAFQFGSNARIANDHRKSMRAREEAPPGQSGSIPLSSNSRNPLSGTVNSVSAQHNSPSEQDSGATINGRSGNTRISGTGASYINVRHSPGSDSQQSARQSAAGPHSLAPPQPGADMLDWKAYLDYQLNSLRDFKFLGGLVMLTGSKTRLHGGQAVVQMCSEWQSGKEFAVKFFLSNSAFLNEAKLYQDHDKPLGRFLPEVLRMINCPVEGVTDAHGVPLPPCIVMEKGESLDHWTARGGDAVDRVTGLQVLTHVAERLTDLHACGYVHRDIKPGNVMWLPRKNRWTLIDFGCAARTGEKARKGFSFSYAAPEVIKAVRAEADLYDVSEGVDVWSVGILAIEMFTGKPVYSTSQTKDTTMAMIMGEQEAPWEKEDTAPFIMHRLGLLRQPVLAALCRDDAQRPSMAEFLHACHRVLNGTGS